MNIPSILILKETDTEPSYIHFESQDIFKVSRIRGCLVFIQLVIEIVLDPLFSNG